MTALFEIEHPVMGEFDATRCMVRSISYDTVRQVLAVAHYIGTPGSTSVSLGLYVDHIIAGVITFGTIPKNNAASVCGEAHAHAVMELTRLALYDWAPHNSESWFIGRALEWMRANRPDITVLLSYADGSVGHVGTIYQATNWIYTGASTNDVVYRCNSGELLHPRTIGRMAALPPGKWEPSPAKHRYVTFVGTPAERRRLRRLLRWEQLPYPKAAQGVAA